MVALAAALLSLGPSLATAEPARALFSAVAGPAAGPPRVYGTYARGCIAGAVALPESGPGWQTMRPGRNRAWGHPKAAAVVARLGAAAQAQGWPGVLIGDVSQPRGGPMPFGHASHQIGLDIDVWLTRPAPRPLTRAEREGLSAVNAVAPDRRRVSPAWTEAQARIVMAAAEDPAVARIFVNAAIKAELCRWAPPGPRDWLGKVRPWWGHDHHFHVRLHCPADSPGCVAQEPAPPGDGCDASLDWWFSEEALNPPPPPEPQRPRPPLTLADLPPACAAVLRAR